MSDEEINQLIRAARNTTGSPFVNRLGEALMEQRERAEAAEKELSESAEHRELIRRTAALIGTPEYKNTLTQATARAEAAEKRTADLVAAYDHNNPLRTADVHPLNCTCMRCAIDKVRAALEGRT